MLVIWFQIEILNNHLLFLKKEYLNFNLYFDFRMSADFMMLVVKFAFLLPATYQIKGANVLKMNANYQIKHNHTLNMEANHQIKHNYVFIMDANYHIKSCILHGC